MEPMSSDDSLLRAVKELSPDRHLAKNCGNGTLTDKATQVR